MELNEIRLADDEEENDEAILERMAAGPDSPIVRRPDRQPDIQTDYSELHEPAGHIYSTAKIPFVPKEKRYLHNVLSYIGWPSQTQDGSLRTKKLLFAVTCMSVLTLIAIGATFVSNSVKPSATLNDVCAQRPRPIDDATCTLVNKHVLLTYPHNGGVLQNSSFLLGFDMPERPKSVSLIRDGDTHSFDISAHQLMDTYFEKGSTRVIWNMTLSDKGSHTIHVTTQNGITYNTTKSIRVPPPCNASWTLRDEDMLCYRSDTQLRSFADAKNYCQSIGAELVSIYTPDQNDFIRSEFVRSASIVPVERGEGYRKLHKVIFAAVGLGGSLQLRDSSETWIWQNGTVLNYANWKRGQPSKTSTGEGCIQMRHDTGVWEVINCTLPLPHMCYQP